MKGKFVQQISVIDPDTKLQVEIDVFKLENGAMVAIDSSFLANTDEPVYSPYDLSVELDLE
jgi:hypothetical protein